MTDNPLVLVYAGPDRALALQARAGAQLLLGQWPGAEVREQEPVADSGVFIGTLRGMGSPGRTIALLGILHPDDAPGSALTGVYAYMTTPDASIVMQVWRALNPTTEPGTWQCVKCDCRTHKRLVGRDGGVCVDDRLQRVECPNECGVMVQVQHVRSRPWHVAYIDDAVCERDNDDARAFMAWAETWCHEPGFFVRLRSADHEERATILRIGRAILRSRARWEEERGVECGLCDHEVEGEEIARLRTERDAMKATLRKLIDACDRLMGDTDPLEDTFEVEAMQEAVALCELAGVDRG